MRILFFDWLPERKTKFPTLVKHLCNKSFIDQTCLVKIQPSWYHTCSIRYMCFFLIARRTLKCLHTFQKVSSVLFTVLFTFTRFYSWFWNRNNNSSWSCKISLVKAGTIFVQRRIVLSSFHKEGLNLAKVKECVYIHVYLWVICFCFGLLQVLHTRDTPREWQRTSLWLRTLKQWTVDEAYTHNPVFISLVY